MDRSRRRFNLVQVAAAFKYSFDLPGVVYECGDDVCRGRVLSEGILSQLDVLYVHLCPSPNSFLLNQELFLCKTTNKQVKAG